MDSLADSPKACVRRCSQSEGGLLSRIRCGCWEEQQASTPTLILCDGQRLLRISPRQEDEEALEFLSPTVSGVKDEVEDMHLVNSGNHSTTVLFLVCQRQIFWMLWPPGAQAVGISGSFRPEASCTASHSVHGLLLAYGSSYGYVASSDGQLEAKLDNSILGLASIPLAASAMAESWAVFCSTSENGHTCCIFELRTLKWLIRADLHCLPRFCFKRSCQGQPLHLLTSNDQLFIVSNCFVKGQGGTCPVLVSASLCSNAMQSPSSSSPKTISVDGYVLHSEESRDSMSSVEVCSAYLFDSGSSPVVAMGLSNGTVILLRPPSDHMSHWHVCGRHTVGASFSPIVACGFVTWGGTGQGMFAAAEDKSHRIWISDDSEVVPTSRGNSVDGCPGHTSNMHADLQSRPQPFKQPMPESTEADAFLQAESPESARDAQSFEELRRETDIGLECKSTNFADIPSHTNKQVKLPKVVKSEAAELLSPNLPSFDELQALVDQTELEIAELESQEQLWSHVAFEEFSQVQPTIAAPISDELSGLVAVNVPNTIPVITRMVLDSHADMKCRHQDLDPTELSRDYLARSCLPKPVLPAAYWPPAESLERWSSMRKPFENSIESLSFNPLEHHIEGLW